MKSLTAYSWLRFYDENDRLIASYSLPNFYLISYNKRQIHQVLTLNFFRFLDHGPKNDAFRDQIYHELALLSPDDLASCLENIGKQLTVTSEFNFYGAHQIDFSTLEAISYYKNQTVSFSMDLPALIDSLNKDALPLLLQTQKVMPNLFKSYRFVDYLLTQVKAPLACEVLEKLKSACKIPLWQSDLTTPKNKKARPEKPSSVLANPKEPVKEAVLVSTAVLLAKQRAEQGSMLAVAPQSLPLDFEIEGSVSISADISDTKSVLNNFLYQLQICGSVMGSAGIAAILIGFICLNVTTLGTAGLVIGSLGAASLITGAGLFAYSRYKQYAENKQTDFIREMPTLVPGS